MQCPELFSPYNGGCIYDCTQHAMFTLNTEGGQAKCVYTPDAEKKVSLTPLTAIPVPSGITGTVPLPTMEGLRDEDPQRYTQYSSELTRVGTAIQSVLGTIQRDQQIRDAFKALQTAEDTRDSNPEGYQLARNTYYTLTKGDAWVETERQRLLDAEIEPEAEQYRSAYTTAKQQKDGQQKTLDIVTAVKDRVLSMKDDFQYTTTMFKDQLETLKSQLNIERRGRETSTSSESTTTFYRWFETLLNLLIAIAIVYGGLTLWRTFSNRQQRSTTYTVPPPKA